MFFAAVARFGNQGPRVSTRDISEASGVFGGLALSPVWVVGRGAGRNLALGAGGVATVSGCRVFLTGQAKAGLGAALSVLTFCKRDPVQALVVAMIARANAAAGPVPDGLSRGLRRLTARGTGRSSTLEPKWAVGAMPQNLGSCGFR